jgi:hypothetical protein
MTPFEQVIQILDQSLGGSRVSIGAHGAFWRGITRGEFVAKQVFGMRLMNLGHRRICKWMC